MLLNLIVKSSLYHKKISALVLFFLCFLFLFVCFIHFIFPFGKFGPPYLGKVAAAARAGLPSPTRACWVFSCFCNSSNSDMDCIIFNVRTWSFLYVRIHTGLCPPTTIQHNIFDSQFLFLCSCRGSNLGSWISSPTL